MAALNEPGRAAAAAAPSAHSAHSTHSTWPTPPQHADRRSLELHASARPLIALATQLRLAVVYSPERMKLALAVAVERLEAGLAGAGWDQRGISAASYLLCSWVDEVVADTPWGAGDAGLLQRFHGERRGSDRILRLLSALAEAPQENRALLELFHACLSLGLNGHLRGAGAGAQQQLDQLRTRVFLTLPQPQTALAPPCRPAVKPGSPTWRRHLALVTLLLLGLVTLGVYTVSHLRLAERVDEVFSAMQQIATGGAPAPARVVAAPAPPGPPRLAPL
ncbi:type IVB secretion system protein IcmH/DotU, partial [Aquabacterium sp.]|uniref:type IVB secretion system protein IcmH/DotU n=1 Tax=Aquabacterium sp. TaxID=1872578 RepID=UPI002C32336F